MAHGDARVGKVKGKLVNGVGSQYPSHFLEVWCIQYYYLWRRTTCLPVIDWTDAPRRLKWIRSFCRKTKCGFCVCAITFQMQSNKKVRDKVWHRAESTSCIRRTSSFGSARLFAHKTGCFKVEKARAQFQPLTFHECREVLYLHLYSFGKHGARWEWAVNAIHRLISRLAKDPLHILQ
jgi:hypothetical protein